MLDQEAFTNIVRLTPLISIDLIIRNSNDEVLLGLRNNRPAQGFWFVPGGRILKNERKKDALIRIAEKELGLGDLLLNENVAPKLLGVYEHFYNDCFAGEIGVSTHYVVLGHVLNLSDEIETHIGDDQHTDLRWWKVEELMQSALVHQYTKDYFTIDSWKSL